ncbi:MAG: hypothetical protein KC420_19670 [Myxococcales bacterium]|nr:hypothetical protein [Myxococcales bacterium]
MSDYVLIDGDRALFEATFGAATVAVKPGSLVASGPATRDGRRLCVVGDEGSVEVKGCTYVTGQHTLAGAGTLAIAALAGDHIAQKSRSGDTPLLLVGGRFVASFTVDVPAKQPTAAGPVPDATPTYSGAGSFVTANDHLRGV